MWQVSCQLLGSGSILITQARRRGGSRGLNEPPLRPKMFFFFAVADLTERRLLDCQDCQDWACASLFKIKYLLFSLLCFRFWEPSTLGNHLNVANDLLLSSSAYLWMNFISENRVAGNVFCLDLLIWNVQLNNFNISQQLVLSKKSWIRLFRRGLYKVK